MWPFDWKSRKSAKRFRQAFGPYLSQEAITDIMAAPTKPFPTMEKAEIHFVLFQVRDDEADAARNLMTAAMTIAADSGGVSMDIMSSIALVTFGVPIRGEGAAPESSLRLADELVEKLGPDIRVAHGGGEGPHGFFGARTRFTYGVLVPGFSGYLKTLLSANFGTIVKVGEP
jgi:hypothetical protein